MNGLVLCGRTLPQTTFAQRVELAAGVEFTHVSMMGTDCLPMIDSPDAMKAARDLLGARGIRVAELDAVTSWLPSETELSADYRSPVDEEQLLAVGEQLGARSVNVVDLSAASTPPLELIAEAFAAMCERAANHGLLVSLEFIPWTRIPDLQTAVEVARLAGCANGGVMFDTWHHFRSGGTLTELRAAPAELFVGLQINDAPESERNARTPQPVQRRLFPGDGVIGVAEMLSDLNERGCDAPVGFEVTSDKVAQRPARETMRRLAESARRVVPGQRS